MTTINFTEFTVVSTDSEYRLPGDWTADSIKASYGSQISGLSSMVSEERIETRGSDTIRVITFKPRTGTKG